jgi:hypothetical protein
MVNQRHGPAAFSQGMKHGTHYTGGWFGPRADLKGVKKKKYLWLIILQVCRYKTETYVLKNYMIKCV